MKFILTVVVTCLFVLTASSQEFKFEKEVIDYGKIEKGTNKAKVFEFVNIGNQPLIIKQVISTCGCAVPKKPEHPIMPGKKGKIEVSYDTNRVGAFSKMFTIVSNAKTKRKRVKIKGLVNNTKQVALR
ncbi:MAG: DUF1573 domain-containing protein [Tenacibaculum sp.]